MKKLLLFAILLVVLTGCSYPSISRVDKLSFEQQMYTILPLKVKLKNQIGRGYKYYTPKGITRLDSKDNNDVLKSGNNKYYLYVDIVDYYYKNELEFTPNKNLYYSDKISYKDKHGYLQITEKKKKLYVEMVYNYAKIETYIDKDNLNDAIRDISYVLSSIEFNDTLLKKMYEEGTLGSKEEVYKLFDNKEREGNFIEYVEEYDKYNSESNNTINANN